MLIINVLFIFKCNIMLKLADYLPTLLLHCFEKNVKHWDP